MGILRTDRVSGLGGANAIKGSVYYKGKSFIKVEPDSSFTLGTGDYTVESWVYSERSYGGIFQLFDSNIMDGSNDSGPGFGAVISDGEWNTYYGSGSIADSGVDLERSVWQHVALVRYSGTTKIYINGTSIVSQSDSTNYTSSMIFPVIGGWWNNDYNWQGYMSNFRFVVGTAVYQSNFTPPTSELTAIDGTQILCFQTSDILREETGKTLVIDGESNNNAPIASRFTPNSPVGFSTTTDVGTQFGTTFDGVTTFDSQAYMVPPGGNTRERNRGRAIIAGGTNGGGWGTKLSTISFIQIQSGGITQGFGELSAARTDVSSVSSSTRAVFGGGSVGATSNDAVNILEFVTISTSSIATDFGDLIDLRRPKGGVSNNIRGLFGGGEISPSNKSEIDHVIIATAGNATDFGDLLVSGTPNEGSSNSTRGVWMGGGWGVQIEMVTIASTGSSTDFGNIGNNRGNAAGASSTTRALCAGGGSADTDITFIEFATLGNDSVFGDLTQGRRTQHGTSNALRGIFCGGYTPDYNIIDAVTIATTGDAVDFGDLTTATREPDACSDSHGGVA